MKPEMSAAAPQHSPAVRWSWRSQCGYALVNLWLCYHLIAMVAAPASVGPSSRAQRTLWWLTQPYLQALYLNHGWHFFSPEPGRSTLLEFEQEFADGRSEAGVWPNRDIRPRLLYHRYFMLTEFLGNTDPARHAMWHRAFANDLLRQSGAERVRLTQVTHELQSRARFLAGGGRLDDPATYQRQPLGTFERTPR